MAKSSTIAIGQISVLGEDENEVEKYSIVLIHAYNEVITIQVQVLNPDWEEGQPDPDDPPQFIAEDRVTTTKLFGGNYPIEVIHDAGALTAAMLEIEPLIQESIRKYNAETALATNPTLLTRASQLEDLLNA